MKVLVKIILLHHDPVLAEDGVNTAIWFVIMCLCMCMCICVRVCVCTCVCACMPACWVNYDLLSHAGCHN